MVERRFAERRQQDRRRADMIADRAIAQVQTHYPSSDDESIGAPAWMVVAASFVVFIATVGAILAVLSNGFTRFGIGFWAALLVALLLGAVAMGCGLTNATTK